MTACISAWSFFNSSSTAISLEGGRKDTSASSFRERARLCRGPETHSHHSAILPLLPNQRPVTVRSSCPPTLGDSQRCFLYPGRGPLHCHLLWDSFPATTPSLGLLSATYFILTYQTSPHKPHNLLLISSYLVTAVLCPPSHSWALREDSTLSGSDFFLIHHSQLPPLMFKSHQTVPGEPLYD